MTETKPEIVQAEPLPSFVVEALASKFVLHSLIEAGDPTRLTPRRRQLRAAWRSTARPRPP